MTRWSNRDWRTVPMPDRVAALPRDKRGFPVPWVSEWSGPDGTPANLLPAPYPIAVGAQAFAVPMANCDHVYGEGIPDLGALCTGQQMKGMLERRCDVCGDVIPEGPIYFLGDSRRDPPEQHGDVAWGALMPPGATDPAHQLFRECGLHYECALYAAQVCPAMLRIRNGLTAGLFRCTTYRRVPFGMALTDGDNTDIEEVAYANEEDFAQGYLVKRNRGRHLILSGFYAVMEDCEEHLPLPQWVARETAGARR